MRIGFVGLGNMGHPMVANLLRSGHELTVHDIRREAADDLVRDGAIWAAQGANESNALGRIADGAVTAVTWQ